MLNTLMVLGAFPENAPQPKTVASKKSKKKGKK